MSTACYALQSCSTGKIQGLRALFYLDDGIIDVEGKEATLWARHKVRLDPVKAGLVKHTTKCTWEPRWMVELWAGSGPGVHISTWRKNSGIERATKIISMSLAVGPVSRLMTRSMHALLNTREQEPTPHIDTCSKSRVPILAWPTRPCEWLRDLA